MTNRSLSHKQLGQLGEALAADELVKQGYVICTWNWRCPLGEIDIVARDGETWVFVEVKLRRSTAFGSPEEALTPRKQAKLLSLASAFIESLELADDPPWRLDVIAIELSYNGDVRRLSHLKDAVRADG